MTVQQLEELRSAVSSMHFHGTYLSEICFVLQLENHATLKVVARPTVESLSAQHKIPSDTVQDALRYFCIR